MTPLKTKKKSSPIDVSFIMTVYNKEYYLPSVLKALLGQTGLKNPEFIFIDDVSTDKSVQIIRKMTKGIPNVRIVTNDHNRGISHRINQGIKLAKGYWSRMLDSDDILPLDSTAKMIALAEKLPADMIYGCFQKTGLEPEKLEKCHLTPFKYTYYPDALLGVLTGRFTRMGQLIKTSVLQKSGGADEHAFIQDESIPLRSASLAKGIAKIDVPVVLVPKEIGNFSGNKIQLDHDRFMAYYWMIRNNPNYSADILHLMYKRALSAYWKFIRKTKKCPYIHLIFYRYIWSKISKCQPSMPYLNRLHEKFLSLKNIRRITR